MIGLLLAQYGPRRGGLRSRRRIDGYLPFSSAGIVSPCRASPRLSGFIFLDRPAERNSLIEIEDNSNSGPISVALVLSETLKKLICCPDLTYFDVAAERAAFVVTRHNST